MTPRRHWPTNCAPRCSSPNGRRWLILQHFEGVEVLIIIVGIFILIAVAIGGLVLMIIAGVKAASGELWRYPLTIRFVNR